MRPGRLTHEHEQGLTEASYHEYHQARLVDGSVEPHNVAGIGLEAVGVATGGGPGRAEPPARAGGG